MEQWNISEQSKIISLKEINQQDKYKLSSRKKKKNETLGVNQEVKQNVGCRKEWQDIGKGSGESEKCSEV